MMFFLRPGYFWFAPFAIAVLIALYMLKLRRDKVVVPSLLFWSRIVQDETANTPLQRLRSNLLFLIQCLLIAAIVIAAAQPSFLSTSQSSGMVYLIVDTGLTMETSDRGETRLQEAIQATERSLYSMHPRTIELISAGSQATIVTPLVHHTSRIMAALQTLRCDDGFPDIAGAINLATDLATTERNDNPTIELVTDGCWAARFPQALRGAAKAQVPVRVITVGNRHSGALMLSACNYAYTPQGNGLQVFASVHNAGTMPMNAVESLRLDGVLIDARSIRVNGNGNSTQVYQLPIVRARHKLEITLNPSGDLPVASRARLIVQPPPTRKVLLVGTGTEYLRAALLSDPTVRLWSAPQYPGKAASQGFDLIVFCNTAPASLPRGNYLFIHCTSNQSPVRSTHKVTRTAVESWERRHPAMRYVNAHGFVFPNSILGIPVNSATDLAKTVDGDLIVARRGIRHRQLFCGFSVNSGAFVVSVGFPIFVSNAVRWLTKDCIDVAIANYEAGKAIVLPNAPAKGVVQVTYPDRRVENVNANSVGVSVVCNEAGFYTASAADYHWTWAINPKYPDITSLGAHRVLGVGHEEVKAKPGKVNVVHRPVWRFAVLLVLGLLCLEWWVYYRPVGLK